jgi:hypothetical protein
VFPHRLALTLAAGLACAAVVANLAAARPPVLLEVGRSVNQPTARWSLPAGVRALEICFDAIDRGNSECWSSIYDTYFAPQTERLRAGTYRVYVLGHDGRCGRCPEIEKSNALRLVIPAPKPSLSVNDFSVQRRALRGAATLDLCDSLDDNSGVNVVVSQARLRNGRLLANRQTVRWDSFDDLDDWGGGCGQLRINWRIPPALARRGDTYRVRLSVVNGDGGRSKSIAREVRW